jgi:hypothetical protein
MNRHAYIFGLILAGLQAMLIALLIILALRARVVVITVEPITAPRVPSTLQIKTAHRSPSARGAAFSVAARPLLPTRRLVPCVSDSGLRKISPDRA